MAATNEMLSNSAIRYNYLIGSIPEVIGELNLDGTISFVSPQVYDLLGYHPDEMIGTNFITFIHPDDVQGIKKIMKKANKSKEVSLPSLRLKHKNGNYILVFAKGKLIKLNDKARLIGFIRGINKFNETEQKLKESEERFKYLISSNPAVIYTAKITSDYGATFISDNVVRLWGFEPKSFIENSEFWLDHVHPDDKELVLSILLELSEKDHIIYDYRFKIRNNTYRWMRDEVFLIRDDRGNPKETIGSVIDITDRKISELKLKESKEKYKSLFEQSPMAILLINFEGKIEDCNNATEILFGYTKEELLGIDYLKFDNFPLDTKLILAKSFSKFIKTGVPEHSEIQMYRKDGKMIWISSYPISVKIAEISYILTVIQNITDRVFAEHELQENERLLKNAQELAHIGHWKLNTSTMKVSGSDELFKIYGLTDAEATTEQFVAKFVHPEDKEMVLFHVRRGMEKGESWDIEHRVISKNGTEKWIHSLGEAIKDGDGKVITLMGTVQDITERKIAEQKLGESEEKFRLLFESIADPIHVVDADLKIIYANPAFARWLKSLGLDSNIVGKTPTEAFPFIDEKVNIEYQNVFKTNQIFIKEDWAHVNDKHIFTETRKIPILKSGNVIQVITIIRDFSDRKNAEKKIIASEKKYRQFIESAQEGIWIIDKDAYTTFVNPKMTEMLGYAQDEMLGKHLFDFMDEKGIAISKRNLERRKQGIEEQHDFEFLRKNGTKIYTILETSPLTDESGGYNGAIAFISDITERKEAEQKLKESEEKYRSLVEDAQEGIWALDENENTTFANPRMCEMLGYTKNEMMGKNIYLFIPDSMKERIKGNRIRREKGIKETYDLELVKKDGTIIYTNVKAAPIMSESRDYKGSFAYITDITTQKQAEVTLRESEEKFKTLFEIAPASIIVSDLESNITLFNQKFCNLHGITQPELLKGRKIQEFIAERNRPMLKEAIIKTFKEEPRGPIQYTMIKEDGTEFLAEGISSALKDKNGKSIGLIGVVQDITERVRSEQKLIESEEKFRTISEQSLLGIVILQDDRYKYVNQAAADMLGYTVEELLDAPQGFFMNYVHPEDREFVREQATKKQLGRKDVITKYQYRCLTKSGETIWIQNYSRTITYEGKSANLITVIDFTERKKAQKALKESEKKYRALFENTPIGVTISDYEGHVIEINERMKRLLGYELEEFQKLGVASAYANDQDRIPFKERLEKQGHIKDYEVDLKKKDGNIFPALVSSIKTNISGEPIYLNTIRDITEKKEIEEIKTHLLTRFSHEFKTPLISIKGFSDLLLSEYKNKLDEKLIGFLEKIRDGGERLKLLVNAFMQSSQLGEKLTTLNIDIENLSDLIKLGVSEMEGLIHIRKHTINMDIPEKLIGEFDKEKIYTVITNLLMNAIKYTPPEGKIFIHSKIEEENIFFSIKDSGIGLTEEDKRHLFKSFGKIERYGKGWDVVSEGMGVGLYLSKEIIILHGGKLWAESEGKNKGSTFYFSLPMTNN